jgi:hypothetical protein
MKRGVAIDDYLKPLATNPLQCYLTNTLQVADVVEWVLNQVGKSSIWQTSFSISEEFLRRLYFISKSGKVETIRLVLDFKATNKTLRLWTFLTQVIEHTYLADNHSKVILIRSVKGDTVSIITSQNLTRGNRMESALVTTDPDLFNKLQKEMQYIIRNKSVPLHELYERAIGGD